MTAEWHNGEWKWGHNQQTIPNVPGESPNTFKQFTLPDERMLTGGQTYYWAVEVEWQDEVKNAPDTGLTVADKFQTKLPEIKDDSHQFSSVTVLTRGVVPPESKDAIDFTQQTVDAIASFQLSYQIRIVRLFNRI